MPDPIQVVSMGTGDASSLGEQAIRAIADAEMIIGEQRFRVALGTLQDQALWQPYPKPFRDLPAIIESHSDKRIVLLASGDALFYGVGSLLRRQFEAHRLIFHPNVSSLQSAVHALGLPWQDLKVVSLHGRPLSSLRAHLAPGEQLGLFTDEKSHPAAIAEELVAAGFEQATLQVCENLGSPEQAISTGTAAKLRIDTRQFHALNVCIVNVPLRPSAHPGTTPATSAVVSPPPSTVSPANDGSASALAPAAADTIATGSSFAGIADEHFSTGSEPGYGMISKREVRLAILSLMQPCRGEVAWDIGAGCGSVSVEWARANPGGRIHAIELDAERLRHVDINRERFGVVTNCLPLQGEAPACCHALPAPHCIFIGGSTGQLPALLEFAWAQLGPGGKLVASGVTSESQRALDACLHQRHAEGHDCDWCEITVRKNLPGSTTVRELRPVHLLRCIRKPTT